MPTRLAGPILLQPQVFADERGFFVEAYNRRGYAALGVDDDFVQDNHSRSRRGTVRGLHFQLAPGQPKLVRVVRGAIHDVVVDLRRTSATFAQHETYVLNDENQRQLYIPVGFAHGFCSLTDEVDVIYKVASYYDPAMERGIAWDDPEIGVAWPAEDPIVSRRDRSNPTLAEILAELPDW